MRCFTLDLERNSQISWVLIAAMSGEVPLRRSGKRGVSLSEKTGVDPAKKGPGAVHFSMGGLRKWYFSAINLLRPQISPESRVR